MNMVKIHLAVTIYQINHNHSTFLLLLDLCYGLSLTFFYKITSLISSNEKKLFLSSFYTNILIAKAYLKLNVLIKVE